MAKRQHPNERPWSRSDETELSVIPAISEPPSEAIADSAAFQTASPTGSPALSPHGDPDTLAPPGAPSPATAEYDFDLPSSEVSVIEALEDSSSSSTEAGASDALDHGDDRAPTQVMRLAFSGLGPPSMEDGAEPLEVRSWRHNAPTVVPLSDRPDGGDAFAVADTLHSAQRGATRVDTEQDAGGLVRVDLELLRRDLEEIERLVRATKAAAAGLDLQAARGLNAQLTSALHRIAEVRSRLR